MTKHVGKHNNQKVVILFREVPDEAHMCLVVYSDLLNRMIHDELMKAVDSQAGQATQEMSEVLHRTYMPDGRVMLTVLHQEGMIKKVPCNQVLVTPNAKSSVRLDELNGILNEMKKGEEAVQRLAEIDSQRGMSGKVSEGRRGAAAAAPREVGMPMNSRARDQVEGTVSAEQFLNGEGVLSDADIAAQRRAQATVMKQNAASMLAEAARLETEAQTLSPTKNAARKTTKTSNAGATTNSTQDKVSVKAKATKKQEA
jgi:hypothetical protein